MTKRLAKLEASVKPPEWLDGLSLDEKDAELARIALELMQFPAEGAGETGRRQFIRSTAYFYRAVDPEHADFDALCALLAPALEQTVAAGRRADEHGRGWAPVSGWDLLILVHGSGDIQTWQVLQTPPGDPVWSRLERLERYAIAITKVEERARSCGFEPGVRDYFNRNLEGLGLPAADDAMTAWARLRDARLATIAGRAVDWEDLVRSAIANHARLRAMQ